MLDFHMQDSEVDGVGWMTRKNRARDYVEAVVGFAGIAVFAYVLFLIAVALS